MRENFTQRDASKVLIRATGVIWGVVAIDYTKQDVELLVDGLAHRKLAIANQVEQILDARIYRN